MTHSVWTSSHMQGTQETKQPLCPDSIPSNHLHSNPPFQYTIVFPLQRIKESWEKQFSEVKMTANKSAPPTQIVSPVMSPPPTKAPTLSGMSFLHPILLHSNRVDTMVSQRVLPLTCAHIACIHVPLVHTSNKVIFLASHFSLHLVTFPSFSTHT